MYLIEFWIKTGWHDKKWEAIANNETIDKMNANWKR